MSFSRKGHAKRFLIFGGTGSLGTTLTRIILSHGFANHIGIVSRDEAKNFYHRQKFRQTGKATLHYYVGDIRNYSTVFDTIVHFRPDVIIHAAAMKQVPLCEDFPSEAIATNVRGTENIMRAATEFARWPRRTDTCHDHPLKVLSISTDKAVKPVNAYGCTKQLQERITLRANDPGRVTANCVRYGNVLESTGSVIPVFKKQLSEGSKLTVTDPAMTRFLLSLDEAVDLIYAALRDEEGGKIFVPKLRSAYIYDVASAMLREVGKEPADHIEFTGVRPGEKLHEILISEEECERVYTQEDNEGSRYVIGPEQRQQRVLKHDAENDFSSNADEHVLLKQELLHFLREKGVIPCESESQAQAAL